VWASLPSQRNGAAREIGRRLTDPVAEVGERWDGEKSLKASARVHHAAPLLSRSRMGGAVIFRAAAALCSVSLVELDSKASVTSLYLLHG